MKKIMMIAALMLMSIGAFAQEGKMAVGAQLGFASYDNYSPLGIGGKFQYEFVNNFRGEASFNYWFPKNSVGFLDANLNLHYLFAVAEKIKVYPLGGATLIATHGGDESHTMVGFNIGGGAEFYLQPNLKLNLEAKYQGAKKSIENTYSYGGYTYTNSYDIKANGLVLQAGIAYVF